MSLNGMLNGRVDLYRRTKTADGSGGFTEVWNIVKRKIPVRVWRTGERRTHLPSGDSISARRKMVSRKSSSILVGDRVYYESQYFLVVDRYSVSGYNSQNHYEYVLEMIPRQMDV